MKNKQLHELFEHEINDLYSAEVQIVAALKAALDKLSDEHLKNVVAHHLKETEVQQERLLQLASESGFEIDRSLLCKGMQGILLEGKEALSEHEDDAQRDVAFALSARRVEHYEMAGYMAASQVAVALEEQAAVTILDQTLEEEKEADNKLVTVLEDNVLKKLENE